MQESKDIERNQAAPYQDPPGLIARELIPFEPVTIRGYKAAGGALAFESDAESSDAYGAMLQACQELCDRGIIARVDVVKRGTTDLIGSMIETKDLIKSRLAELLVAGRT